MTPEMMDEVIACGLIFFWFMVALTIGGLVADYVLPHIGPIERYLESLPDFEDDETNDHTGFYYIDFE